jgi:hypothetical protein
LGMLWEWLPEGALNHEPNAYLESERYIQPERSIQIVAGHF